MSNWTPISSLLGVYEVTPDGRVRRSANRRELACPIGSRGYRFFSARVGDGTQRNVTVHSVVAECFIGARPTGLVINHKDGNRTNNAAANLEYVTARQNEDHARDHGLKVSGDRHPSRLHPERRPRGENNRNSKLKEADVRLIRDLRQSGETYAALGKRFVVSAATASCICRRRTWASVA